MAGATARVLVALQSPPPLAHPELLRGPIRIAPTLHRQAEANRAWRAGTIASDLPTTLRVVSALDPGLAPPGAAVMTLTLGAVPFRLFDGPWTKEKRDLLCQQALRTAEEVLPGTADRVVAAEVITPNDMAEELGATEGDLWGGEVAADQMLDFRPDTDPAPPRTPIPGLYLAGPSSPLGPMASCASGVRAAEAILSDMRR
jgi:phytoene dehydrogenase-like protein